MTTLCYMEQFSPLHQVFPTIVLVTLETHDITCRQHLTRMPSHSLQTFRDFCWGQSDWHLGHYDTNVSDNVTVLCVTTCKREQVALYFALTYFLSSLFYLNHNFIRGKLLLNLIFLLIIIVFSYAFVSWGICTRDARAWSFLITPNELQRNTIQVRQP